MRREFFFFFCRLGIFNFLILSMYSNVSRRVNVYIYTGLVVFWLQAIYDCQVQGLDQWGVPYGSTSQIESLVRPSRRSSFFPWRRSFEKSSIWQLQRGPSSHLRFISRKRRYTINFFSIINIHYTIYYFTFRQFGQERKRAIHARVIKIRVKLSNWDTV